MVEFTPHEAPAHQSDQLPVTPPPKLIGRDITLGRIYTQLKDNKAVLVHGPTGIGKTALGATLASAYAERPGGVLYLACDGDTLSELIVRTGRALRVPEAVRTENPLTAAPAVAAALKESQPLLVLDGLLNPGAATEFVTRCATGVPVLLLNDDEFPGDWLPLRLGRLEPDQAVTLFKQAAGIDSLDLDGEIGALAAALNFTPFALTIAAGTVQHTPDLSPRKFLDSLPNTGASGVNAQLMALTGAFRALNSALQGLMMVMGAGFSGGVTAEMLSLIGGATPDAIRGAMTQLVNRHLVEQTQRYGQSYYHMHAITHTFMQTWLKAANRLDSLQTKVRDSVLQYAHQHSQQGSRGQNALAAEMDLFLATASWAAEDGDRDTAAQLAAALMQAGTFVRERGYVYELLLLRRLSTSSTSAFPAHSGLAPAAEADKDEELDELDEADEAADELEDADTLDEAAEELLDALDDEAEADESSADQAAPAPIPFDAPARANGPERRQQADTLLAEARQREQAGDPDEALQDYAEALSLLEALQDTPAVLNTLEAMARVAARSENAQAAVTYSGRGIKLAEDSGDDHNKARLLGFLGDARQQLGESGEAITAYEQALTQVRQKADRRAEGVLLFKLGYAQLDEGDPDQALETWQGALALFRAEGRRDYEGRALGGIGTAYSEQNRWPEAIDHFTQALKIARETGDDAEALLELSNLAYALVQNNQLGAAVTRYRQALHLAFEADDAGSIIAMSVELARLLVESPRHLAIAELLINAALQYDPHDQDLKQLQERIEDERTAMPDLDLKPVGGTARAYAANAYAQIDKT